MFQLKKEEFSLQATPRYIRENMSKAMRGDIVRGLVELITNSDESYKDLEEEGFKVDGGIVIEIERKRKEGSMVKVRDRAEGMSFEEMKTKIARLGERTSGFELGKSRRGLHGRGAKDILNFGKVEFESIKDNEYTKLTLSPNTTGNIISSRVDNEIRNKLRIKKNGTVVTIFAFDNTKVPLHEHLKENIANYYSLRDICSNQNRKILLTDLNSRTTSPVIYKYPEGGEVVFNQSISLPSYPEAPANIIFRKFPKPFERNPLPYRDGILIKSNGAIHDCEYFGLEQEPLSWRFSGEIICSYIDRLAKEFDDREEKNVFKHPKENPMRIIDPDRDGLITEHPFTKILFAECKKELTNQIEKIRLMEETNHRKVTNAELNKKLENLAKEMSSLYKKELNELNEEEENLNIGNYSKKFPLGLHIIPGGNHDILKGKKKTFTVIFVSNDNLDSQSVKVSSNNSKIKLNKNNILLDKNLSPSSGKGNFTVEGLEENQQATITVSYKEYQSSFNIRVVEVENLYQMPEGLFFDKNKSKYYIVYGKHKIINIYLKTNQYIENKIVWLSSSQPLEVVILGGSSVALSPTIQPHLFKGKLKLEGRRKKASAIITAKLEGFNSVSANIVVEERDNSGIHFEYEPTEEECGIQRYKWDLINKTKLWIGAKHPSIRRYLGELKNNQYPGINSLLYHSVLAEVIASAHAFEILKKKFTIEGEERRLDFETASNFFHTSFTKFLTVAHRCLVDDSKIRQFI